MGKNKNYKTRDEKSQLLALEKIAKTQDSIEIKKLSEKLGKGFTFGSYIEAINNQTSFHISFDQIIDDEE